MRRFVEGRKKSFVEHWKVLPVLIFNFYQFVSNVIFIIFLFRYSFIGSDFRDEKSRYRTYKIINIYVSKHGNQNPTTVESPAMQPDDSEH